MIAEIKVVSNKEELEQQIEWEYTKNQYMLPHYLDFV